MNKLWFGWLAILVGMGLSGCGSKTCKDGTMFVEIRRGDEAKDANELGITVELDGTVVVADERLTITPGTGTDGVELDFANYLHGQRVTVTIVARAGGVEVSRGTATQVLGGSCERIVIGLGVVIPGQDAGAGDGGGAGDACAPALSECPASACGSVDDGCGTMIACATPCLVTSVSTRLANSGDVLLFEGRFAPGATVDFPGAPGVALTLLGTHRATATVPAAATAGAMTVHSGGAAFAFGSFRRANFALTLQNFSVHYAQAEHGRQMPRLLGGMRRHALVATPDWLYVLGGASAGGSTPASTVTVQRLRVGADGSLESPIDMTSTSPLAIARYGHRALRLGDRLYVIGGTSAGASTRSIEYATINADGTLSAFTLVPDALTVGRSFPSVSVIGDHLYVVGGRDTLQLTSVERAPIAADGSLGAFSVVTGSTLQEGRYGHAAFVTSTQLVIVSGDGGAGAISTIETAPIAADGTLGAFTTNVLTLPGAMSDTISTQWADKIYVMPYISTVAADGSFAAFTDANANEYGLPNGITEARLTVVRDGLYFVGGFRDGGTQATIARGGLEGGARIGAFANSNTIALPEARNTGASAVIGKNFYLFGGDGPNGVSAVIYKAPIAEDDTLGAFTTETVQLPAARDYHGLVVAMNQVFIVGGVVAGVRTNTVVQAPINADGTIGVFTSSTSMATGRSAAYVFAIANNVCAVGGATSAAFPNTYASSFECAPVAANGTLGAWGPVQSGAVQMPLVSGRAYGVSMFYQNKMAVISGAGNNTNPNNVETKGTSAWVSSDPWAVEAGVSLPGSGMTDMSGLVVGDSIYLFGGSSITTTTLRNELINFNTPFIADGQADLKVAMRNGFVFRAGNMVYEVGGLGNINLAAVEQAKVQ